MKYGLWFFVLLSVASSAVVVGCTRKVHGGDPAVPLSNINGTTRIFPVPENTILVAITNAFTNSDDNPMGYRGMSLTAASVYSSNKGFPEGLELFPTIGPIANVPLRGSGHVNVPYTACFNIEAKAVNNSNTSVTVRTVFAMVVDGKEIGVHGGWANHQRDVPPVRAEEENVLNAISNSLATRRAPMKSAP